MKGTYDYYKPLSDECKIIEDEDTPELGKKKSMEAVMQKIVEMEKDKVVSINEINGKVSKSLNSSFFFSFLYQPFVTKDFKTATNKAHSENKPHEMVVPINSLLEKAIFKIYLWFA